MLVVDTSIWIEFFKNNKQIKEILSVYLETLEAIALEWVFAELLQGAKSSHERSIIKEYYYYLPKIEATNIWLEAGEIAGVNKFTQQGIGLIDAAILTAAKKAKAKLWTLDRKLQKVAGIESLFLPKID